MSQRNTQEKDKTKAPVATKKSELASEIPPTVLAMLNSRAVRWYVLTVPACHRGAIKGLQTLSRRRMENGEPELEFFAPTYVEVRRENGTLIKTNRSLLYNYLFIRASETEIYQMMRTSLSLFSFLPRVRDGKREHYPYLPDEIMQNLQWIARSYSDVIPVYAPNPGRLIKGDRVRIIDGEFKDVEATVFVQPGSRQKEIVVCVENWMWIPLLRVQPGQYEVISLNVAGGGYPSYTHLNNDRLFESLHQALQRVHAGEVTAEDRTLASETIRQYGSLRMDSEVTRSKLYALLLPAYTILGDNMECEKLIGNMQGILTLIKAEQSQALLLVTLYGCTDNSIYYDQAHRIVEPWRSEEHPKKIKAHLLRRLDDYDQWLGHRQ